MRGPEGTSQLQRCTGAVDRLPSQSCGPAKMGEHDTRLLRRHLVIRLNPSLAPRR